MAIPNCCGCEARKRSRLLPQSARHLRPLIHLHSLTRGNDSMQTCTDHLIGGPGLRQSPVLTLSIVSSFARYKGDRRTSGDVAESTAHARARARGKSNERDIVEGTKAREPYNIFIARRFYGRCSLLSSRRRFFRSRARLQGRFNSICARRPFLIMNTLRVRHVRSDRQSEGPEGAETRAVVPSGRSLPLWWSNCPHI